jgi:alpha-tubulin suppressor-like RCC1 family protein
MAIDVGDSNCALMTEGAVYCWGPNYSGQLGDGVKSHGFEANGSDFSPRPVLVRGATGAIAISSGDDQSCALFSSGAIRCWGANDFGQLGSGGQRSSRIPVAVRGISNAIAISAGANETCAVLSDGSVECWGSNYFHELGDGIEDHGYQSPDGYDVSPTPVRVQRISDASAVSVGDGSVCALLHEGTVACWGSNDHGQLGDGVEDHSSRDFEGDFSPIPVMVSDISDAEIVSVGEDYACALRDAGTVTCWGRNDVGQLGNGTLGRSYVPIAVTGIGAAAQISAGTDHACALLADGPVDCWGNNFHGELGDGSQDHDPRAPSGYDFASVPVHVKGLESARQISSGVYHSCASLATGAVKCWGDNRDGELGNGVGDYRSSPVEVNRIDSATSVSAGGSISDEFTCALLSGGRTRCWGSNRFGELGHAGWQNSPTPTEVASVENVVQIATGDEQTCALLSGGTVKCWGFGQDGELGNGKEQNSPTPVAVKKLARVRQMSVGGFACALLESGTVECWGANDSGQLGDGVGNHGHADSRGVDFSPRPVRVQGISDATAISVGEGSACALLSTGTVKCWGEGESGELGDGRRKSSSVPVLVKRVSNAVQVALGYFSACARLSDGRVECWGSNERGQLGDGRARKGARGDALIPVTVRGISTAKEIGLGDEHGCALLSSGRIDCWGNDDLGQLGNGKAGIRAQASTPVRVAGIKRAVSLSATGNHNCVLLRNGTIKCWGANESGELGNGEMGFSTLPVRVIGLPRQLSISYG